MVPGTAGLVLGDAPPSRCCSFVRVSRQPLSINHYLAREKQAKTLYGRAMSFDISAPTSVVLATMLSSEHVRPNQRTWPVEPASRATKVANWITS
jgi:hypothetical protein